MIQFAFILVQLLSFNSKYPNVDVEIVNAEMLDPEEKVAFRGYYNRLQVKGLDFHTNYYLITRHDTLHRDCPTDYGYTAPSSRTDTIWVVLNGIVIHQEVFQIRNMPRSEIKFGYVSENQTVPLNYILSNPGLHIFVPGYPMRLCIRIQMFEAKIIKQNGKEIPLINKTPKGFDDWSDRKSSRYRYGQFVFHVKEKDPKNYGNKFSQSHLKLLKKLEIGDRVSFGMGTFSCPSCIQSIKTLNLTITVGSK